jgi:hypothetical protein
MAEYDPSQDSYHRYRSDIDQSDYHHEKSSDYSDPNDPIIASSSNPSTVRLRPILKGINYPSVIKHYPAGSDNTLAIATLTGQIWLIDVDDPHCRKTLLLDLSDKIGPLGLSRLNPYDERGLLGLEFSPDYEQDGRFYVYYSKLDCRTSSPPVNPVDPCRPKTQHQRWSNLDLYSHINTLEEWCSCICSFSNEKEDHVCRHPPRLSSQLLQIKQPFHNNNGQNNLTWDHLTRTLLLVTGDGGYLNDPFDLAQNDDFVHGKILNITVSAVQYPEYIFPVARLSSLPRGVRQAISISSKGIRNSHGLFIYQPYGERDSLDSHKPDPYNDRANYEFLLTHNGQSSHEGLFRYNPSINTQPTQNKNIINLGWSGWDNGQPTSTKTVCSRVEPIPFSSGIEEPTVIKADDEPLIPTTRLVSWNKDSTFDTLTIRNGDSLRFLSTDGRWNNVYMANVADRSGESDLTDLSITASVKDWNPIRKLISDAEHIDFTYQPIIENIGQYIYFMSTKYPETMRLAVKVEPVATIPSDISTDMAALQSSVKPDLTPFDGTTPLYLVTYPNRIMRNKMLPYFRYPHRRIPLEPESSSGYRSIRDMYRQYDSRRSSSFDRDIERLFGSRITGVTLHTGNRARLGRGLIISEWNRRIHDYLSYNHGVLIWINLDPLSSNRFDIIRVRGPSLGFYVTIGSNRTFNRTFVGVYGSPYAGILGLGSVVEVISIN